MSYCMRKWEEFYRFVGFVTQHFIEDDCTYRASALAFSALLAVVPLMSVGLAVLSSFPVFHNLAGPLQDFIFDNFVPATGKVIQGYLQQFAAQVTRLPAAGLTFLLLMAILVLYTIEQAMNKIWRVTSARHGVAAFLLYWAIISLAPLLLGMSVAVSSYVLSMPFFRDHSSPAILSFLPILLSLLGFTFLYVIVPNCKVKIRHGLGGAVVAAILFETAKIGFAWYLTRYNTYELLYGAFASIPIFFIWVYWVWFITLLGAEISFALSVHHERRFGQAIDGFSHALLWLRQLWQQQQAGRGVSFDELINVSTHPFAVDVDAMTNLLLTRDLIHKSAEGDYRLSRDMETLTLYELAQLLPYPIPSAQQLSNGSLILPQAWVDLFLKQDALSQQGMAIDLRSLFAKE